MRKKSVLVIDDSAFMRKLISEMINSSQHFYVCGTAVNGEIGLQKMERLNPDVVTLDLLMPVKDGLDTLKIIMKDFPRPVIMVSAYTKAGARSTIRALELGAFDFIAKPSGEISPDISLIREELLEKLRSAIRADLGNLKATSHPDSEKIDTQKLSQPAKSHRVISIAASTGGPQALLWLLPSLPSDIPATLLIVQHMPRDFTNQFAQRLDKICKIKVKEAEEGDLLRNGWAFIAPGDYHLTLDRKMASAKQKIIKLNQDPPVYGVRPSADVLFYSVAACCGSDAMGIVLTGMGKDGAKGLRMIRDAGGLAVIQSPESAVINGMPKAAISTAGADNIVPLDEMGNFIIQQLKKYNN